MVKPDVLVCSSYSQDYPLWREQMERHLHLFNTLFVGYYNDFRKENFLEFIQEVAPYATHIDVGEIPGGLDWRNVVIRNLLRRTSSDWILFLEQDFVGKGTFFYDVFEEAKDFDVVGFKEGGVRLHPAFLLVRREFVDKTSKDFSAHPNAGSDHFGVFASELEQLSPRFLDISARNDWKHYAGITSNMMLAQDGKEPNYKPEEFKEFLEASLAVPVEQDPRFRRWSSEYLRRLSP